MMIQLNPPIHVLTPLGEGDALMVIDYGCHLNTVWVVWLFAEGKVTHFDSSDIRVMGNLMYGIPHPEPPGSPLAADPPGPVVLRAKPARPARRNSGARGQ
jgi:hypothetical protein